MNDIEWDSAKDVLNRKNHRVSFAEAATIFNDPMQLTVDDPSHSVSENRYYTMGHSSKDRLLVVFHTFRNGKIRLISARRPTRSERLSYENA